MGAVNGAEIAVDAALDRLDQAARMGDATDVSVATVRLMAVLEAEAPGRALVERVQAGIAAALVRLEARTRVAPHPARLGYGAAR